MNTKRKALIVSAILIGLGGFYIYKNMKKTPETKAEESAVDTQKQLSIGSTGDEVVRLQTALKGGLIPDGNFGALTEKRLKAVTGKTSISIREYNAFMASKTK